MKERKKNERPAAATAERSTGAITCPGADSSTTPCTDYITPAGRKQGYIEQLLLPGVENAITTAQLLAATRFRSARDLQQQIERERSAGALILSRSSHGGGYFLPASRVLREVPGQTQIVGGGDRGQA